MILIQDVKFNISIAGLKRLVRGLVVNENEEIAVANRFKEAFDIRTPSVQTLVWGPYLEATSRRRRW